MKKHNKQFDKNLIKEVINNSQIFIKFKQNSKIFAAKLFSGSSTHLQKKFDDILKSVIFTGLKLFSLFENFDSFLAEVEIFEQNLTHLESGNISS